MNGSYRFPCGYKEIEYDRFNRHNVVSGTVAFKRLGGRGIRPSLSLIGLLVISRMKLYNKWYLIRVMCSKWK
ncbi:hypothetical protein M434DRAFT_335428 [Hypoxylon sp. CO27-5]|nr:hypothetical protein M434DRAFT_335428 [Hypoxylon sp. CO27-5]